MGEEYFIQKAECDSEFVFAFAKAMKFKTLQICQLQHITRISGMLLTIKPKSLKSVRENSANPCEKNASFTDD